MAAVCPRLLVVFLGSVVAGVRADAAPPKTCGTPQPPEAWQGRQLLQHNIGGASAVAAIQSYTTAGVVATGEDAAPRVSTRASPAAGRGAATQDPRRARLALREDSRAVAPGIALLDQSPDVTVQSPDETVSETEYVSYSDRIGYALFAAVLSPVVLLFALSGLWMNERRAARMDALFAHGERECVRVDAASPSNRGELLHVASGRVVAKAPIEPKLFSGLRVKGCLRLRFTVEVYQWIEECDEGEETADKVGGGKTRSLHYNYEKRWSSRKYDSSQYLDRGKQNKFPMPPQVDTIDAPQVEYEPGTPGEAGWIMPVGLLSQFKDFQKPGAVISDERLVGASGPTLRRKDGFFYSGAQEAPQIGDVRVSFSCVPDKLEATVVALQSPVQKSVACPVHAPFVCNPRDCKHAAQAAEASSMGETFLPYRPIARGWCGIDEDTRKEALLTEGQRSREDLGLADDCSAGPLSRLFCCCLCACGVIGRNMAQYSPPEIFHAYPGCKGQDECFADIKAESAALKWALRLFGWVGMLISVMMAFQPLIMLIDIVPFVEYLGLTDVVEVFVFSLALCATAVVSLVVISVASLVYRPAAAMVYLSIATIIAAVPLTLYSDYLKSAA